MPFFEIIRIFGATVGWPASGILSRSRGEFRGKRPGLDGAVIEASWRLVPDNGYGRNEDGAEGLLPFVRLVRAMEREARGCRRRWQQWRAASALPTVLPLARPRVSGEFRGANKKKSLFLSKQRLSHLVVNQGCFCGLTKHPFPSTT